MTADEVIARLVEAQEQGSGEELLLVTPEQAEKLAEALDGQRQVIGRAHAREDDGRAFVVRG